ncbi:LOW QUALITY PROTEIN: receptor-type tyrosine-protein phosphatase N2 [Microcaecilia unicolor]|uniref:LOW QUALITY PROTEIN: receptor-type tyrosine-protein phosphatase N2 n=1 Tax=Microcaecilia unicolor TaxID=1415580 RepID=A0A6P7XN64_9AMPH|nr:LOW QUALITY PROTEIN: receptor-type tyrosine-protein phosphatase N2 [Microcaecilia unicolor]
MMEVLCFVLLVLSAFQHPFGALAERKFGCLFEDDLCKSFESCLNDGVFGRCQRVPVTDVFKYEVSLSVLRHLRTILQKLSYKGLTWQDDYTQHVIASELSNIPKVYSPYPETISSDGSNKPRASKQSTENGKNYELEKDVNFAKSLQQYLGFMPQSAALSNLYQRTKVQNPPIMSDNIQSDHLRDYMLQKSKASPSVISFPPMSLQKYPETLSQKVFTLPPAEKFPSQAEAELDRKSLLTAIKAYVDQKKPTQNLDNTNPSGRTKALLRYPNRFFPSQINQFDGVLPKEDEDTDFKMKMPLLQRPGAKMLRPNMGKLVFITDSPQGTPKDPLSTVDESFIQNVVKELGKHKVNIDNFSTKELDELANIIADTLQALRQAEGGSWKSRRASRCRTEESGTVGTWTSADGSMDKDTGTNEDHDQFEKEEKGLGGEMEDFFHQNAATEKSGADDLMANEFFNMEPKKSKDSLSLSSSEEEDDKVGIENVKSETFTKELTVKNKMNSELDSKELNKLKYWMQGTLNEDESGNEESQRRKGEGLHLEVKSSDNNEYGYIMTNKDPLSVEKGLELIKDVADLLKIQMSAFSDVDVLGSAVTFQVHPGVQNVTTADVTKAAAANKDMLGKTTGVKVLKTGMGEKSTLKFLPHHSEEDPTKFIILTLLAISCIIGVLIASGARYCVRHRSHHKLKEKFSSLATDSSSDATAAYQELCRQRIAVKSSDHPEPPHASRINSVSSQFSDVPTPSPTARSSTSSWCEEPVQSNMDISTGHLILSYMEDHLKNKNRLEKEWEALCAYQAEPNASTIAQKEENGRKNRSQTVVAYDHSRIQLKTENSHNNSDYINASPIMDHDPRNPAYIATQGPLAATVSDFWQMVWENGCVVIVMLTPLSENGVTQCHQYWPDEGSNLYHIYEVNLVSEHIWCEDFLVRSFYLKNLQTSETRTVTQFHFLSWNDQEVPPSTRSLLDFRRKVNKCYRGRSCPIIVHCSDGAGRSGTYILIDMVLNKMAKGAKEIDIAATLEHLRDQRPGMVQTKEQFEFALTAVAEEVNAILKALPQ